MPTYTTNYSLSLPLVNDPIDEDLWGGELNADLTSIDALLKTGIVNAVSASQTTGFTAVSTISTKNLYPCDASGGSFAVTLPTAASAGNGSTVFFKKTSTVADTVTITRASSDTIDGATTYPLTTQYQVVGLVSDGVSKWYALNLAQPVFTGDSGSGGIAGLVPAPAAGDAAANKFLKASGAWTALPSSPILAQGYITSLSTTPSVAGGSNIASVSRVSAGKYTVTFTSAAVDSNYIPTGTVSRAANPDMFLCEITSVSTAGFTFTTRTSGNDLFDPDNVRLIVFKGA